MEMINPRFNMANENPKEKKHKEYHSKTHHSQIAENKNEKEILKARREE